MNGWLHWSLLSLSIMWQIVILSIKRFVFKKEKKKKLFSWDANWLYVPPVGFSALREFWILDRNSATPRVEPKKLSSMPKTLSYPSCCRILVQYFYRNLLTHIINVTECLYNSYSQNNLNKNQCSTGYYLIFARSSLQ